jgi:transposase
VGPRLAGVIVLLALRMRLSRASIRELLREVFDLTLSTGVIDETIREAGRASFPLETPWWPISCRWRSCTSMKRRGRNPACCCGCGRWSVTSTVLYLIGPRTREMLENALQDGYTGILISDGYGVYRNWDNRLRCWPHLMRKLRGWPNRVMAGCPGLGRRWKVS